MKERSAGCKAWAVSLGYKVEKMLHERVKRKRAEGSVVERTLLDRALEAMARLFVSSLESWSGPCPCRSPGSTPGRSRRSSRTACGRSASSSPAAR